MGSSLGHLDGRHGPQWIFLGKLFPINDMLSPIAFFDSPKVSPIRTLWRSFSLRKHPFCQQVNLEMTDIKAIVFWPYVQNVISCPYLDQQTKLYCETYSRRRYMRILHLTSNFEKIHFYKTENFWVKSWFLETFKIWPKSRKNILTYVFFDIIEYVKHALYYMKPCLRGCIRLKTWQGCLKKNCYIHAHVTAN